MTVGPHPVASHPTRHQETALQTFSPREVQARVRAGETAEAIAGDTGWALDKVVRYAEPLLAERAYIAEQAQAVEVRRSGGIVTLREAAQASVDSDLEWDAYRRDDGRWIVTAAYTDRDGEQVAAWTYDHAGRNLHPQDDQARGLMGARPVAARADDLDDADIADALNLVAPIPVVRAEPEPGRPRLVAVPDADEDGEDDGVGENQDDDLRDGTDDADADEDTDATRGTGRAGRTPVSAAHPTVALPTAREGEEPAAKPRRTRTSKAKPKTEPAPAVEPAPEPKAAPAKKTAPKAPAAEPARKPRTRKGRASVPTWDEILFGSGKPED